MRQGGLIFWLVWRDPTLWLALVMAWAGFLIVPQGSVTANSVWMAIPVFFAAASFLIPVPPFEAGLPILRSQIVLARILAVLATVWLPLAAGCTTTSLMGKPWSNVRRPVEFGALLTATMLLAWAAYASSSRRRRWVAALLALAAGTVSLPLLPWAYGGAAAGMALIGIWIAVTWATPKSAADGGTGRARAHWLWPLLQSGLSWRLLFVVPFATWLGLRLNWSTVPFLGFFLMSERLRQPWLLQLPMSRRALLWGMLLPVIVPFLAGMAAGYRMGRQDWTIRAPGAPSAQVPLDYYVSTPDPATAEIRSPWGETARPPTQLIGAMFSQLVYSYNPYWVGPGNSRRFAEWQFARETRDTYGQAFTAEAIPAAIRAGLKPLPQQPRMEFLTIAFGAGVLLAMTLAGALRQWYRLCGMPRVVRAMLHPFGLPVALLIYVSFFVLIRTSTSNPWDAFIQVRLLHLSAVLPRNDILMTAVVLAALAALYAALETVFNQVEFPNKKTQETV
jgi:hypothetical protein